MSKLSILSIFTEYTYMKMCTSCKRWSTQIENDLFGIKGSCYNYLCVATCIGKHMFNEIIKSNYTQEVIWKQKIRIKDVLLLSSKSNNTDSNTRIVLLLWTLFFVHVRVVQIHNNSTHAEKNTHILTIFYLSQITAIS